MKRFLFYSLVIAVTGFLIISCNNNEKEPVIAKKTLVDSLQELVDDGHIAGMAKMGKLTRLQQKATQLLDSINKLPAKAQQNIAGYKAKLEEVLKDLNYAEFAMDKWMNEFYSKDTTIKVESERVEFLQLENQKVVKVKEAILSGINKADSLFR